jgi:multiple sugar transport system substrate-binding protein
MNEHVIWMRRSKMKLWFVSTLSVLLVMSAGYSGRAVAAPSRATVTLTYGFWDPTQAPAIQQIINAFEKSHPTIKVTPEVTPFAQYWTKLQTSAAGGSAPDTFWMNGPNFYLYASNGQLMSLKSLINKDHINMGNYPKSLVNLYTYKGTVYALPKDFDTIGLWYNKSMFQAAHVSFPNASWTWSTFRSAAKKLTDPSKGVWGFSAYNTNQEGYYNTIFENNGYVISPNHKKSGYDSPNTIGGLKFWTNLIKDKSSPSEQQMTESDKDTMFQSGKVAMEFGGDWLAITFKKSMGSKVDVAVLPKGKSRGTVIHGLGNVMYAKTKHPQEAWEWVKFLGSQQAALILAKTGTVIPAFNSTQGPWLKSIPQYHLKNFIDELPYAHPFPISKDTAKWEALETTILTKAWAGQMSITAAAKQLAQQMNAILAQE